MKYLCSYSFLPSLLHILSSLTLLFLIFPLLTSSPFQTLTLSFLQYPVSYSISAHVSKSVFSLQISRPKCCVHISFHPPPRGKYKVVTVRAKQAYGVGECTCGRTYSKLQTEPRDQLTPAGKRTRCTLRRRLHWNGYLIYVVTEIRNAFQPDRARRERQSPDTENMLETNRPRSVQRFRNDMQCKPYNSNLPINVKYGLGASWIQMAGDGNEYLGLPNIVMVSRICRTPCRKTRILH